MSQYLLPRELGGYWAQGEPLDDGTVWLTLPAESLHADAGPLDGAMVVPASWLTELPEPPPVGAFVLCGRIGVDEVADLLTLDDELPTLWRSAIYRNAPRKDWPEVVRAYPYRRVLVPRDQQPTAVGKAHSVMSEYGFTVERWTGEENPGWFVFLPHACSLGGYDIAGIRDSNKRVSRDDAIATLTRFIAEATQALDALLTDQPYGGRSS